MPVPLADEDALARVHRTCADAVEAGTKVQIDAAAVAALAGSLTPAVVKSRAVFFRMPMRFDDAKQEVNFLALYHLLDFGSGFDALLRAKSGRDAHEVVQFGMLGLLMADVRLDAPRLAAFSAFDVFQYFGVDQSVEEEVRPGITMTKPGPLAAFVERIRSVLNTTGAALQAAGHKCLGELILESVDTRAAAGAPPSAAALVGALAEAIPGFDDKGLYEGQQVFYYRKAQALAAQLHLRFRGEDPGCWAFADADALTLDSGSTVPAVLRRHGVLRLSEGLAAAADSGADIGGDPRERLLRAATVVAGKAICAAAGGAFCAFELSMYLCYEAEKEGGQYAGLQKMPLVQATDAY